MEVFDRESDYEQSFGDCLRDRWILGGAVSISEFSLADKEGSMRLSGDGVLVRIFIGESDQYHRKPLYEQIVLKAREEGLAGATVLRGIMGFGAQSHLHTAKILRLAEDLPVVIEIVDTQEHIDRFMPFLDEAVKDGMITVENVRVLQYRSRPAS